MRACSLLLLGAIACGEAAPNAPLLEFEGIAEGGELSIDRGRSIRALQVLPVVQDGVSGSGPPQTIELETLSSGTSCGGPPAFCGLIRLRSFFTAQNLEDLFVEITWMSPSTGYEALNGLVPPLPPEAAGLSARYGLFDYPVIGARGHADRLWSFRYTSGTSFRFRGRVMGELAPARIGASAFTVPAPWARPIDDYLAAGNALGGSFRRGIHDLVPHDGRLFLSYGDADRNMGQVIPIWIRSFVSPDQPAAIDELETNEEEIRRFRKIGAELYAPGLDNTADTFLGNLYAKRGSSWQVASDLRQAVHVHDVAVHGSEIVVVGSGATRAEWSRLEKFGLLWISTDGGASHSLMHRESSGGGGDSRLYRVVRIGSELLVFGFKTDLAGTINRTVAFSYSAGGILTPLPPAHPLGSILVTESDALGTDLALLRGSAVVPAHTHTAWRVDSSGSVTTIPEAAGRTIFDVHVNAETGEMLLLLVDGDDWVPNQTTWNATILVTEDLLSFTELVSFTTPARPKSIAYYGDRIFLGTDTGEVWRASRL